MSTSKSSPSEALEEIRDVPENDEDLLEKENNPVEIMARLGVDFSKLIKRAQVRLETAVSFDTLAESKTELKWADIFQGRARIDVQFDPAIVKAVLQGLVGVLGDPGPDKLAELGHAYFTTFVKHTHFQIQLSDLAAMFAALRASKPIEPVDAERELKTHNKSDALFFYLLSQPFTRIMRAIADDECRSTYRYHDNLAILAVAKTISTLASKDIEEVSAVHVRMKTGQGVSLRMERAVPVSSIAKLIYAIKLNPPPDYAPTY